MVSLGFLIEFKFIIKAANTKINRLRYILALLGKHAVFNMDLGLITLTNTTLMRSHHILVTY